MEKTHQSQDTNFNVSQEHPSFIFIYLYFILLKYVYRGNSGFIVIFQIHSSLKNLSIFFTFIIVVICKCDSIQPEYYQDCRKLPTIACVKLTYQIYTTSRCWRNDVHDAHVRKQTKKTCLKLPSTKLKAENSQHGLDHPCYPALNSFRDIQIVYNWPSRVRHWYRHLLRLATGSKQAPNLPTLSLLYGSVLLLYHCNTFSQHERIVSEADRSIPQFQFLPLRIMLSQI